jgi:hypothetical protein
MVELVELIAQHGANIRAKSLILSTKNYCNHRAPMQWKEQNSVHSIGSGFKDLSDTQEQSMLINSN